MLSVVGVIVVMTLTAAPAETPLCELGDALLGRWVGEASLLDHAATTDEKQGKVRAELRYRWAIAGHVLEGEWQRGDVSGKWLAVWDPEANRIKTLGGRSDGNAWEGVVVKKNNGWVEETEGSLGDGARILSRFVTVFQDDGNRIVWEGDFSIDGEKQEPVRDVYEKANAGMATQEEFKELRDTLRGRLVNTEDTLPSALGLAEEGSTPTTYDDIMVVADGHAISETYFAGDGIGKALTFWDPASKAIKMHAVFSNGSVWEAITYKKKGKWVREVILISPTGEKTRIGGSFTVSADGNTHTWINPTTDKVNVVRRVGGPSD